MLAQAQIRAEPRDPPSISDGVGLIDRLSATTFDCDRVTAAFTFCEASGLIGL
jgi:hypothetical protein